MAKRKEMTVSELARKGGRAVVKKYGKRQMREWGKLGGRPRKKAR